MPPLIHQSAHSTDRYAPARTQVAKGSLPSLAALYLVCVVVQVGFPAGPLAMTTLRLLLLLVTVPLAIGVVGGRFGKPLAIDYLFFAHILWVVVALAVNNPDRVIEQSGSVGIEFIGGYLVGRATIRSREDFIALCRYLVWIVVTLLPLALIESQNGRSYIIETLNKLPIVSSVLPVDTGERLGLKRVQSTFAHPIHFGLFCSIAFSLTFVALKGVYSNVKRWILSGLTLLSGFLALSSGALLALALQIALITWHQSFRSIQQRWWLLLGIIATAYFAVDLLSNRSPLRVFMSYATFSSHNAYIRTIIFDWGLDNVVGNAARDIPPSPWFGIGMNNWIRAPYLYSSSVDNFWLLMVMRYGLPGFFLLAAGFVLGIARVIRRDFEDDVTLQNLRLAWVFTFLGLTFTLCTVAIWTHIYSFVFFMFGAGMWFISTKPKCDGVNLKPEMERSAQTPRMRYTRFGEGVPPSASSVAIATGKHVADERHRTAPTPFQLEACSAGDFRPDRPDRRLL